MPGSHKGPTYDHHANGFLLVQLIPIPVHLIFSKAARVTGKAGACSFHHVRAVHGSEQNLSGKDRVLLLYQAAAADAWDLRRFNEPWEEYESRMIAGISTLEPRVVDTPIRLPYPPAKFDGSIYENQRGMKSRYLLLITNLAHDKEDAD